MDKPLATRLQRLQDAGCCRDAAAIARDAAEAPGFDDALRRHEALADRNRLLIVHMLARQPGLCGCEFQAALGLSHATVSHHLSTLSTAGLVAGERRGRFIHYELTAAGRAAASA